MFPKKEKTRNDAKKTKDGSVMKMTREEAIERFENVKANALVQKASGVSTYWQNEIDGTVEAIDMAIESLQTEQQTEEEMLREQCRAFIDIVNHTEKGDNHETD